MLSARYVSQNQPNTALKRDSRYRARPLALGPKAMSSTNSSAFEDLVAAFEWVSADPSLEASAYVRRLDGHVFCSTDAVEFEEELPEDLEDEAKYVAVPHKHDLDLGNSLALRFVSEVLPSRYSDASAFFRRPGAYRKFKDLLGRENKLVEWYAYESSAVETALLAWAAENQLPINSSSGKSGY